MFSSVIPKSSFRENPSIELKNGLSLTEFTTICQSYLAPKFPESFNSNVYKSVPDKFVLLSQSRLLLPSR